MKNYINALIGISYPEWKRLRTAVDRAFEKERGEFEKEIKLANAEIVNQLIQLQFGQT